MGRWGPVVGGTVFGVCVCGRTNTRCTDRCNISRVVTDRCNVLCSGADPKYAKELGGYNVTNTHLMNKCNISHFVTDRCNVLCLGSDPKYAMELWVDTM